MPETGERCMWARDRIESYIDGDLVGADLEAFERHIAACGQCGEELALAEALLRGIRSMPRLRCPDRVVEAAARRLGDAPPAAGDGAESWLDRLIDRIGERMSPALQTAAAVVIVAAVAGMLLVTQRRAQAPLTYVGSNGAEHEVSRREIELAAREVMLAFAYVGKYSRPAGAGVAQGIINDVLIETLDRTVIEPVNPFPLDYKEESR
jgi:hypothetical protein